MFHRRALTLRHAMLRSLILPTVTVLALGASVALGHALGTALHEPDPITTITTH